MNEIKSPSAGTRIFSLLMGPCYVVLNAVHASDGGKIPFELALAVTSIGAIVIIGVLTVFGVKAYHYQEKAFRFTLASAFYVAIPFALYFSAIRWQLQSIGTEGLEPAQWFWFSVFSILWMLATTAVLLWFAEAIMAIAASCVRGRQVSTDPPPTKPS